MIVYLRFFGIQEFLLEDGIVIVSDNRKVVTAAHGGGMIFWKPNFLLLIVYKV